VICLKNNGNPIKMIWENGIGYLERSFLIHYLHYIWNDIIFESMAQVKKTKKTNKQTNKLQIF